MENYKMRQRHSRLSLLLSELRLADATFIFHRNHRGVSRHTCPAYQTRISKFLAPHSCFNHQVSAFVCQQSLLLFRELFAPTMERTTHQQDVESLLRMIRERQQRKVHAEQPNTEKHPLFEPPEFELNPDGKQDDPLLSEMGEMEHFDDQIR